MSGFVEIYRHPKTIRYIKRPIKRYLLPSFVDGLLVVLAFFTALGVRFSGQMSTQYLLQVNPWIPLFSLIYIGVNFQWRIYGRLWRYATTHDAVALAEAVSVATLIVAAIDLLQGVHRPLPMSQVLLGGLFTFLLMLFGRCRQLLLKEGLRKWTNPPHPQHSRQRALIVGAGDHGRRLARHLQDDPAQRDFYETVGFIDDDPSIDGLRIQDLKVLGTRQQIPALVKQHAVDQIIIASRSSFGNSFDELVHICQQTPAQIKVLPRFYDLLDNHNPFPNLRDLTIEDLLEREPAKINNQACSRVLAGQIILVTGAGGSIGSELCRQLLRFNPGHLLLLDNNETSLHELNLELADQLNGDRSTQLHPLVADVTNARKLEAIFRNFSPQIIFHAAAYKHVPMMEIHPDEAVRVNVMGTVFLTELANRYQVKRFIFISTDKAVNPNCVMGASKRIGELWLETWQKESKTRFASVRFGNVVGSRGSVVPLFNSQIEHNGPVTVTDPRMTRYFMSIPEAATLIIQAGAFAEGGEIYMLDMGQTIRIVDLAKKMIRLKGLRASRDIQIKFIGIRPGEKLHEELSYQTEHKRATPHPKIYCLENNLIPNKEYLLQQIAVLIAASQGNWEMITRLREGILQVARGDVDGCLETLANMSFRLPQKRLAVGGKAIIAPPAPTGEGATVSLHPVTLLPTIHKGMTLP